MFLQGIVYMGNEKQADRTLLNEKLGGAFWHSRVTLARSYTVLERNCSDGAVPVLLKDFLPRRFSTASKKEGPGGARPGRGTTQGRLPPALARPGGSLLVGGGSRGSARDRGAPKGGGRPRASPGGPSLTGAGAAHPEVGLLVGAGAAQRGPRTIWRRLLAPVQVAAAGDVGRAGHPGAQLRAAAEAPGAGAQFVAADPAVAEAIETVGAPWVHGGGGGGSLAGPRRAGGAAPTPTATLPDAGRPRARTPRGRDRGRWANGGAPLARGEGVRRARAPPGGAEGQEGAAAWTCRGFLSLPRSRPFPAGYVPWGIRE